ncbi:glioma pathogenesis-related protein 1-like [Heterodontus francisci]|uniref:glioma pathogenesis-related protein 1-like n=1 Tax=Heterodontus francisci TaxID=7792 RepID=UPI00355C52B9
MDSKFVKNCVDEHNRYRSGVYPTASNMYFMSWDAGLFKTARAWSKTCSFINNPHLRTKGEGHPNFETVGENIYAVSGRFSINDAIEEWYKEGDHYDFNTKACNRENSCKRYTQLVWGITYKLGCAANYCPKGVEGSNIKEDGTVFVCNYSPTGNEGDGPYFDGAPCTDCGPDFCRSNLCSDPDRDIISQYPNWNPDFGSASILLSSCLLPLMSITLTYILW